jgi:hypothetical protein
MHKEIIVKEVIFTDSEIMLSGTMMEGFLSYDTHYSLPISCTNRLLNRLQARNPEQCVADLFVARSIGQNTTVFVLDARSLADATCDLSWEVMDSNLMQVRA